MTNTSIPLDARLIAWRVFTAVVGFAGLLGGLFAAAQFSRVTGLRAHLLESGAAAWGEKLPFGMFAFLVVIAARPRNRGQLWLLLALVVPVALWFELSEDAALAVQHMIARQGSLFIMLSVFVILTMPVFVPVLLELERAGMLEADGDNPGWPIGPGATIAISLPGLLTATLLVDLLRAVAWLPADPGVALAWAILQMFFAALMAGRYARPADLRQWSVLGGTLAAAMIAAVLTGVAMASQAESLDEPGLGDLFLVLTSLLAALFLGWATRAAAHRLTGRNSPWHPDRLGFSGDMR